MPRRENPIRNRNDRCDKNRPPEFFHLLLVKSVKFHLEMYEINTIQRLRSKWS